MAKARSNSAETVFPLPASRATLFGVPMGELGLFASLLMGLASGFIAFFAATFIGIVVVMVLNSNGHPTDYSLSYRHGGVPAGILVGVLALGYLMILWTRRILRRQ